MEGRQSRTRGYVDGRGLWTVGVYSRSRTEPPSPDPLPGGVGGPRGPGDEGAVPVEAAGGSGSVVEGVGPPSRYGAANCRCTRPHPPTPVGSGSRPTWWDERTGGVSLDTRKCPGSPEDYGGRCTLGPVLRRDFVPKVGLRYLGVLNWTFRSVTCVRSFDDAGRLRTIDVAAYREERN